MVDIRVLGGRVVAPDDAGWAQERQEEPALEEERPKAAAVPQLQRGGQQGGRAQHHRRADADTEREGGDAAVHRVPERLPPQPPTALNI